VGDERAMRVVVVCERFCVRMHRISVRLGKVSVCLMERDKQPE